MTGKAANTTMLKITERQKALLKELGILEVANDVTDVSRFLTLILEVAVEQKETIDEMKIELINIQSLIA